MDPRVGNIRNVLQWLIQHDHYGLNESLDRLQPRLWSDDANHFIEILYQYHMSKRELANELRKRVAAVMPLADDELHHLIDTLDNLKYLVNNGRYNNLRIIAFYKALKDNNIVSPRYANKMTEILNRHVYPIIVTRYNDYDFVLQMSAYEALCLWNSLAINLLDKTIEIAMTTLASMEGDCGDGRSKLNALIWLLDFLESDLVVESRDGNHPMDSRELIFTTNKLRLLVEPLIESLLRLALDKNSIRLLDLIGELMNKLVGKSNAYGASGIMISKLIGVIKTLMEVNHIRPSSGSSRSFAFLDTWSGNESSVVSESPITMTPCSQIDLINDLSLTHRDRVSLDTCRADLISMSVDLNCGPITASGYSSDSSSARAVVLTLGKDLLVRILECAAGDAIDRLTTSPF